ncbi:MAG: hypothetical protein WD425_14455 [Nitrospirales bacterium]
MEISYAVLADNANISREGKTNIMGIFNLIYSQAFPCRHNQMSLIASIQAEPLDQKNKDWKLQVVLYDEDSQQVLEITGNVNFKNSPEGELGTSNSILVFNSLTFPKPGTYKFSIFIDGILKKDIRLKLIQRDFQEQKLQ